MDSPIMAPLLADAPTPDDLAACVGSAKRIMRRYLEAYERGYDIHQAEADALTGVVPKPIQFMLRVAEVEARDRVAEKNLQAAIPVFHTYLQRTELAESHLPPTTLRPSRTAPFAGPPKDVTYDHDPGPFPDV
jgi:hypothetical protein